MRARAILDLSQLRDSDFFEEVSNGMRAVLANAQGLLDDSSILRCAGRFRAEDLLKRVAEEEAAKYFILLDAVRTDRQALEFNSQLSRFNEHLAKGLYAGYQWTSPASYGESLSFLERERQELYLDGPNDVDWIFFNDILREREEALYVDYIENNGEHQWHEPRASTTIAGFDAAPRSVSFASELHRAGFDSPEALATIAGIWRGVRFQPEDHWQRCHEINLRTLKELASLNLLSEEGVAQSGRIAWRWLFPLSHADLRRITVRRADLKRQQDEWRPDW